MGHRPLRMHRLDHVFVCSNRCLQDGHLLATDPISNMIMVGKLSLLASRYEVELFAYSFLPNGFWLLLSDPHAHKSDLMRDFQSWLARWRNRQLDREGKLFHERYDDEAVLDAQMFVDTYVDVLVAPVREAFATSLDAYDGATSWEWVDRGVAPIGKMIDRDKLRSLRRTNPELSEEAVATDFAVEIACPPIEDVTAQSHDEDEPGRWLKEKVEERVAEILEWQEKVGRDNVLEQRQAPHQAPWDAPKVEPLGPPKYRYSRTCRTYSSELLLRSREMRREKRRSYTAAREIWRKASPCGERGIGDAAKAQQSVESLALKFPTGTFPPGWVRVRKPIETCHPNAPPLQPQAA